MAKQNQNELIALVQKMTDLGRAQAENSGFHWDNRHPTFCEIAAAFNARDLNAAKAVWQANFT